MLYAIKNLSSLKTQPCTPWTTSTIAPPKTDWNNPNIDHCFYSGFEGLISGARIDSKNNPAMAGFSFTKSQVPIGIGPAFFSMISPVILCALIKLSSS